MADCWHGVLATGYRPKPNWLCIVAIAMNTTASPTPSVTGTPRTWLRIEGLAAFVLALAGYLSLGGHPLLLLTLLLAVDVAMVGYLANPRAGAFVYNLAHQWATGLVVLGACLWLASTPLLLAGLILVGHVGMDRLAGYGLKYPTAFGDTHLGRIGRTRRPAR